MIVVHSSFTASLNVPLGRTRAMRLHTSAITNAMKSRSHRLLIFALLRRAPLRAHITQGDPGSRSSTALGEDDARGQKGYRGGRLPLIHAVQEPAVRPGSDSGVVFYVVASFFPPQEPDSTLGVEVTVYGSCTHRSRLRLLIPLSRSRRVRCHAFSRNKGHI